MSQIPPYQQYPPQPLNYNYPLPPRGHGGVKALAIIGIILASLSLLCGLMGLFPFLSRGSNPAIDVAKGDPLLYTWIILGALLAPLLAIVLLTGSIGLLTYKPWGRMAVLAYAIITLCYTVPDAVIRFLILIPKMSWQMGEIANIPAQAQSMAITMMYVVTAIAILIGLAFPVISLIVLTRPNIKALFATA